MTKPKSRIGQQVGGHVARSRRWPRLAKIGAVTVEGFDAGKWNAAFLDTGYTNLQRNRDGKIVPKPADIANINWPKRRVVNFGSEQIDQESRNRAVHHGGVDDHDDEDQFGH